ncbi:hypothetical protein ACWDZ6_10750 [Streptomyces sp. NPDC002926]
MQPAAAAVRAVNRLTAQWTSAEERPDGTVFSAAGVRPLLALRADRPDSADRPDDADDADSADDADDADDADSAARRGRRGQRGPPRAGGGRGPPRGRSRRGARGPLSALVRCGAWTRHSACGRRSHFRCTGSGPPGCEPGAHALLFGDEDTDRAALDAWASERTDGQIEAMPVVVDGGTELVPTSAPGAAYGVVPALHRGRDVCRAGALGRSSAELMRTAAPPTARAR